MSDIHTAAARGTLFSIALRLVSFLLTQLTVRFVSASTLGKASIQLDLLLATVLFVGREGFRLALTKEQEDVETRAMATPAMAKPATASEPVTSEIKTVPSATLAQERSNAEIDQIKSQQRSQRIVNVSWLSVPVGAFLSFLALAMHLFSCRRPSHAHGGNENDVRGRELELLDYKISGILYCLASFVEGLSEPLVIRCLQQLDVASRAKAEGAALILKAASCFGFLFLTSQYSSRGLKVIFSVTAFGVGQLAYAVVFTSIMYQKGRVAAGGIHWPKLVQFNEEDPGATRKQCSDKVENPYRETDQTDATIKKYARSIGQNFDLPTVQLVAIFTIQGLFKHGLTEADKIVLSALAGSYDQGIYALAASYGGLAARLLLQPVEENARLLFSRQSNLVTQAKDHDRDILRNDSEHGSSQLINVLRDFEDTFCFLIKAVMYIGFLFAAVAVNYTSILLRLLAGSHWGSNAEASDTLSAFCIYTAFLALNGTTEAFVYGVARSGKDVGRLGITHALVGGLFAVVAPALVRRSGAVGLVLANCVSMSLRSAYSLHYARCYFALYGTSQSVVRMAFRILPHPVVLLSFLASYVITSTSKTNFYDVRISSGTGFVAAALWHIVVGISCVILTMALSLIFEPNARSFLQKLRKKKRV